MKQRLHTLLASEKMASSKFADILGVNRSSISHLLSGRNNPSLDILQKVLAKFPHINPDWLILGQGNMYRNDDSNKVVPVPNTIFKDPDITKKEENKTVELLEPKEAAMAKEPEERAVYSAQNNSKKPKQDDQAAKKVERIVFFYSDNTFDTYYPNNVKV